jgi:hypothetical protein
MTRKQFYIEPQQDALLKARARTRGVTESAIVREALDLRFVETRKATVRPEEDGWETFKKLVAQVEIDPNTPAYIWNRDEIYDRNARLV